MSEEMNWNKTKVRRVTVVFMDNHLNKLELVEAHAKTRMVPGEKAFRYRVDKTAAEAYARVRLAEAGKEELATTELQKAMSRYDFIGILIAHQDHLAPGRISWAEEIETQEAVTV